MYPAGWPVPGIALCMAAFYAAEPSEDCAVWRDPAWGNGCCEVATLSRTSTVSAPVLARSTGATMGATRSCQRPHRGRALFVTLAALCQPVACAAGHGAGGHDARGLTQLATGAPVVTTSDGQHAFALRVPATLLDPDTAGHWYIPCAGKELPKSVVATLQQLVEYRVPANV